MAKQSIDWKESIEDNQLLVKNLGAKLLLESSKEKQEELRHQIGKLKNQEHVSVFSAYVSEGTDKLNEEMKKLEERYQSYDLSQRHMFKTETTVSRDTLAYKEKSKTFGIANTANQISSKASYRASLKRNVDCLNYSHFYYCDRNGNRSREFFKYYNHVSKTALKKWDRFVNKYKSPYGYMSWDSLMSTLITEAESIYSSFSSKEYGNVSNLGPLGESYIFNTGFVCSTPSPIFLTHDLIKDFINTDVKSFNASSNEVLPFYTLMLPKNAITVSGLNSDFKDGESNEPFKETYYALLVMTNDFWIKSIENVIKKDMSSFKALIPELKESINPDNYLPDEYGSNKFKAGFKVFALNDKAGYIKINFTWEEGTKNWKIKLKPEQSIRNGGNEIKEVHENIGKSILNIVTNSILLMSYQPEHVTIQSPEISGGFGNSERDKPKQATWLGEHYKQTQVRYEYPPEHVPQKGKSPRSHWRRGHMHTILQGPGRKQRVLKWIKPTFIVGRGTV